MKCSGCGRDLAINVSPAEWCRLEKLQFLLDSRDVIFDPNATAPLGVRSGRCTCGLGLPACDSQCGVGLMPQMSNHPSVIELERTLRLLFTANPGDYRHLAAYRWASEWRVVWVPTWIRGPQGKRIVGEPKPERRRILPPWLNQQRVTSAEAFLAEKFRGEVFIPDELWDALVKPAVTQEIAA